MAFNEFDVLGDDELIEAIIRLRSDIRQVEHDRSQWVGDDGRSLDYVPADDYMLQDERERLAKLIAEALGRGVVVPDEPLGEFVSDEDD